MKWIIENGKQLELEVEAPTSSPRKTPLLFIHGMCHGAWCWKENFLSYFAQHNYMAYALNLQGHGNSNSPKPLRSISIADYVSDIASTVKKLPVKPILIGHSLGGLIVQKYLESNDVPAAVLVASVPPKGILHTTIRFALRRPWAFIRANITRSLYPLVETPEHCKQLLFSKNMPDGKAEKYQSLMQDESYRAFWDGIGLNLPDPKQITTPILVLGAENDKVVSLNEIETTARLYGTEAEMFPDTAHDMMLEARWRDVANRILKWLREKGI